ncbi:MAG: Asp/Glu/hydantoin racemase [Pseudonocardiales bacterium]|nr:Asp/Glu/hydantoin racemase [Pseudonocardiales bacterium]
MRILIANCNTTVSMTDAIAAEARAVARPGTEILALTPSWGPASCEGWYDSFLSAAAVLEAVADYAEPFDALVMAGFGEHGKQGARELLTVPVIDITEAAGHLACLLGERFAVVTTLSRTFPLIEESLRSSGTWDRCSGLFATDLPVLDLETDPVRTSAAFLAQARLAIERGADAIVLGCAGMSSLYARLRAELDIPTIDGVTAAVGLAETVHHLGLATGKNGSYAFPIAKARVSRPGQERTKI